jgi:transcriptional regulator with XRE-family HTH domain
MATGGALTEQDISALRLEMSIKRAQHGLTYNALAEKSSVSRRTVISIETGSSRGSLDSWMRIFDALDCDFGLFLQDLKHRPVNADVVSRSDDI